MKTCTSCGNIFFDSVPDCSCGSDKFKDKDGKIIKVKVEQIKQKNAQIKVANLAKPKPKPSTVNMDTNLSQATMQKAYELVDTDRIRVEPEGYYVDSRGKTYLVEPVTESYKWVCNALSDGQKDGVCFGWKYKRNCKHIEAVKEYQRRNP